MTEARQLLELARRTGIHDQTQVQKLIEIADKSPSKQTRDQAVKAVHRLALQEVDHPFSEQTPTSAEAEAITLGQTWKQKNTYKIPVEELTQHVLAIGQSGAGKTTVFYNIAHQSPVPFWIFDLKQDYRHLIRTPRFYDQLLVIPHQQLRFNPLQPPPGVKPRDWAPTFAEIFCGAYDLLEGSSGFLRTLLKELYQEKDQTPTLYDLQQKVREPGINFVLPAANYQNRITWRLRGLRSDTEDMTQCRKGYSLRNLLKRNVVFELDNLPRKTQSFLMEILLAWIYQYRKAQEQRGSQLRHITILDEAHTIFSWYKEQQEAAGMPEIDRLVKLMREFGESLVAADQEASKLTDSIKANTKTKILLSTADHKEFQAITDSMKLNPLQKQWAETLATGEAVIQQGSHEPLPVTIPEYRVMKNVSDQELVKRMQTKWQQLSYTPLKNSEEKSSGQQKLDNY